MTDERWMLGVHRRTHPSPGASRLPLPQGEWDKNHAITSPGAIR